MSNEPCLGIMQPYFFPYPGHFSLIAASSQWIVFDITQYTPKSWMTRNRILHPSAGWQYIQVPLANNSINITTHEARVLDPAGARSNLLGKLTHYKKSAPYYRSVVRLVHEAFEAATDDKLVTLNVQALAAVCRALDIPFNYRICSQLALELPPHLGAGEWALEVASALGAGSYLNPASGRSLFDPAAFARRGIELRFLEPAPIDYATTPYAHIPHLSILDAMMWMPAAEVARAVRTCYRIV
jgi:hypothetical protein